MKFEIRFSPGRLANDRKRPTVERGCFHSMNPQGRQGRIHINLQRFVHDQDAGLLRTGIRIFFMQEPGKPMQGNRRLARSRRALNNDGAVGMGGDQLKLVFGDQG